MLYLRSIIQRRGGAGDESPPETSKNSCLRVVRVVAAVSEFSDMLLFVCPICFCLLLLQIC